MKRFVMLVVTSCLASIAALAFAPALAGSLDPPGAPAPTMKTLDQVEARTPIAALPFTINAPGSYYLAANLTAASGADGIVVNAASATIDLNGFTLDGAGLSASAHGIYLAAPSGSGHYTIRNGVITRWGIGVWQNAAGPDLFLSDLVVRSSQSDGVRCYDVLAFRSTLNFNQGAGIALNGVGIVRDCRVAGNNGGGILAMGPRTLVEDCVLDANSYTGIQIGDNGIVRNCVITNTISTGGNGHAINGGVGVQVVGNNLMGNAGYGAALGANAYVASNSAKGNGGSGLSFLSDSRVEGNEVSGNGFRGITTTGANCFIVKNTSHGNASANFYVSGANTIAPIDTTGTSTNPWSNFSY